MIEELRRRGIMVSGGLINSSDPGEQPIEGLLRFVEKVKPLAREMRTILADIVELQNGTDSKEAQF